MDEIASIRAFVRVVESGSFAAAGRLLGLSKSVITKRVSELESSVKAQLLLRSTRRLTLTDAGSSYFERCVRIVDDIEDARSAVSSRSLGLAGVLRVSCIASFTARHLSADLCRFQQDHPELTIVLHHNDRLYDQIQEGYDVCIQTSDMSGSGVVKRPIALLRRMLVATPDFLQRHGPPKHPDELVHLRVAHNNFIQPCSDISFSNGRGTITVPIKPVVLSNSIWMIREAVMNGDCAGILPLYFIIDELCKGTFVPVFADFRVQSVTLSAYFRRSAHVPMKVRMLLDHLLEKYRETPPWERTLQAARPDLWQAAFIQGGASGPDPACRDGLAAEGKGGVDERESGGMRQPAQQPPQ